MLLERVLPLLGSFRDRVVVVSGASSGIGRETALAFGRAGARVALLARRRALLEEVADGVRAAGGTPLIAPVDVRDARAVRAAVTKIRRAWRSVDVLVNNAGVLLPGRFDEMKIADLETMMAVNFFGAVHLTRAILPAMADRQRASIVNVASLAGRRGFTQLGGYCASKFALVGLTEALRTEVDGAGIHVGLVLPGVVDTPMVHDVDQASALPEWPSALNMPPEWVVAAIVLAVRFRLAEVSVPPGAATLEIIGALAPAATDTLIGWMSAAGRLLHRAESPAAARRATAPRKRGGRGSARKRART